MPCDTLTNESVDLLNRQEVVDKMITVSEMLSANKKNACYALNGAWGVGKSFVLGMFEKQIVQIQTSETTMGKYLLFHYDCWKYDYYEEPLTAIVAALLDSIDEQVKLFPEETRTKIKGILKIIGIKLAEKINERIEEKTGIDPKDIWDLYNGINEETARKIADDHAFDSYFDFNKILIQLRETIASLAQVQTVILVVDELDRCLPEYTIKVLERLHHVFDDIPNVQMILSIDKGQLQHTVKQIYGADTSTEKYLAKFIDFEIKLDEGSISDISDERFREYTRQFALIEQYTKTSDVDIFVTMFFEGIDMRKRLELIEKVKIIHQLAANGSKMDYSIMCAELFLVLLHECGLDIYTAKKFEATRGEFVSDRWYFDETSRYVRDQKESHTKMFTYVTKGLSNISKKFQTTKNSGTDSKYYSVIDDYAFINTSDLWGKLFGFYRFLLGYEDDLWEYAHQKEDDLKYIQIFWNLLQIIS